MSERQKLERVLYEALELIKEMAKKVGRLEERVIDLEARVREPESDR